MVPRRAILRAVESVGLGLTRSKCAFRDAIDSIHSRRIVLSDSMPVYRCAVVLHRIGDSDRKSISPAGSYNRSRQLAVDQETLLLMGTIRIAGRVGDLEVVANGVSCARKFLVETKASLAKIR